MLIHTIKKHYYYNQIIDLGNADRKRFERFDNGNIRHVIFDACTFRQFKAEETNIKNSLFDNCVFNKMFLANSENFILPRTIFKSCVFQGIHLRGILEETYFINCGFHDINFKMLRIPELQPAYYPFQNCSFGIETSIDNFNLGMLDDLSIIKPGGYAWKKVSVQINSGWVINGILKLYIPEDAQVRTLGIDKSRVSKCVPVSLWKVDEFKEIKSSEYTKILSLFNNGFHYWIDKTTYPDKFDESFLTCSPGIHCYASYNDAVRHS
jgi:hypothetical protein